MKQAIDILVERLDGLAPSVALVLGSGLGGLADEVENAVRIPIRSCRGFRKAASAATAARCWRALSAAGRY